MTFPFSDGDIVLYDGKKDQYGALYNGCWSGVVRLINNTDQTCMVCFDGEIYPYVSNRFTIAVAKANELSLHVRNADYESKHDEWICKRNELKKIEDEVWSDQIAAWLASKKASYSHIAPGSNVSWTDSHTQYTGVVAALYLFFRALIILNDGSEKLVALDKLTVA